MEKTRTILLAVNDITGKTKSMRAGLLTATEARDQSKAFAVRHFPGMSYWPKTICQYSGSRLAINICTKIGV
jgi:roadblock/LC7 domain-containing protein